MTTMTDVEFVTVEGEAQVSADPDQIKYIAAGIARRYYPSQSPVELAESFVQGGFTAVRITLVLHGAGVDHRETEACFEPAFDGVTGLRRIYPDPPRRAGWTPRSGMRPRPTSSITTRTPRSPCSTTRDTPYPTSNRNSCARS